MTSVPPPALPVVASRYDQNNVPPGFIRLLQLVIVTVTAVHSWFAQRGSSFDRNPLDLRLA
jgi:hypothetical protein